MIVTRALANSGVADPFLARLAMLVRFEPNSPTQPRLRPPSRGTVDLERSGLLDWAAEVFYEALGIRMRPNGSAHEASNRMGRLAAGLHIGVVVVKGMVQVHVHSKEIHHKRNFERIVSALNEGGLAQPASSVEVGIRPGPRNPAVQYLEATWSAEADRDEHGERIAAFASWIHVVRDALLMS